MKYWKYAYTGIGESTMINGKNYSNVITVKQADDTLNLLPDRQTVRDLGGFAFRAYSEEKYAKNIGLVYKKFDLWEYQQVGGYYLGFGIEIQLVDHN